MIDLANHSKFSTDLTEHYYERRAENLVDLYLAEKKSVQKFNSLSSYRCSLLVVMKRVENMKKAALRSAYSSPTRRQQSPTSIAAIESMISPPPTFSQHQVVATISPAVKLPRFRSAASVRSKTTTSTRVSGNKSAFRGTPSREQPQATSQFPAISSMKSFEDELVFVKTDTIHGGVRAMTASPVSGSGPRNSGRSGRSTAGSRTTELFPGVHEVHFQPIDQSNLFSPTRKEKEPVSDGLITEYYATTSTNTNTNIFSTCTLVPRTTGIELLIDTSDGPQNVPAEESATASVASELSSDNAGGVGRHVLRPISPPTAQATTPVMIRPIATSTSSVGGKVTPKTPTSGPIAGQGRMDRDQSRSVVSTTRGSRSPSPSLLYMFDKLRPDSPFSVGSLSDASYRRYNEGTVQNYSIRW